MARLRVGNDLSFKKNNTENTRTRSVSLEVATRKLLFCGNAGLHLPDTRD